MSVFPIQLLSARDSQEGLVKTRGAQGINIKKTGKGHIEP